jgi:hypothetical protein
MAALKMSCMVSCNASHHDRIASPAIMVHNVRPVRAVPRCRSLVSFDATHHNKIASPVIMVRTRVPCCLQLEVAVSRLSAAAYSRMLCPDLPL